MPRRKLQKNILFTESKTGIIRKRLPKLAARDIGKLVGALEMGMSLRRGCYYLKLNYKDFLKLYHDRRSTASITLRSAMATREHKSLEKINGSNDWRAHAFILERLFPERWGQKNKLDVNVKRGNTVADDERRTVEILMSNPEALAAAEALLRLKQDGERVTKRIESREVARDLAHDETGARDNEDTARDLAQELPEPAAGDLVLSDAVPAVPHSDPTSADEKPSTPIGAIVRVIR